VILVGAGPGDPDLITVKGRDAIRSADVLVADRLVSPRLLDLARPGAEVIDAGKECGRDSMDQEAIHAILVDRARRGLRVVRLKGGDPFIFGRGGEEWSALREAGIECQAIPGVSSAIGVPTAFGIPLTHRGVSRSVTIVTGHGRSGELPDLDLEALARAETLVILMGRSTLRALAEALMAAGRDPFTPAVCIERGTTAQERSAEGTLLSIADAADAAGLASPVITVVGETVRLGLELRRALIDGFQEAEVRI
jgi:uroporphyrin-III C-methyltransferase